LSKPVVSVGNLTVGGAGKTPVVAHLVEVLRAHGERPAILTRGYKRTRPTAGVTVVSDGTNVLADLGSAGDEPLMLARLLPAVPVLVGADRFQSGERAERDFDVTVHVLDDGFQHLALARDVDLLLVDEHDLSDHVLPAGKLREPLGNAAAAHALLVTTDDAGAVDRIAHSLGVPVAFHVQRAIHTPHAIGQPGGVHLAGDPVLAFAGIARPERFFSDLAASGRVAADTITFADHHQFTQKDIDRIVDRARAVRATTVLTTEKDAVRLEGLDLKGLTLQAIPLSVVIAPTHQFATWLVDRLRDARSAVASGTSSATGAPHQ
jgi:tetraacyldisaccharide 4'-kinase